MIHDYFVNVERNLRVLEDEISNFIDSKLHAFLKDNGVIIGLSAATEYWPSYVAAHGDNKFKVTHSTNDFFCTKVSANIIRPLEVEDFSVPDLDIQESDMRLLTKEEKASIGGM